jgi:hypothetical protein
LEKLHARVKLMENKQEIYQRYVDYLKGEWIKDMYIAKMMNKN